jgi:Protein of unknown function (DUF2808)
MATLALVATALNIDNYANAHFNDLTSPHIDSKSQFPSNRWATVRQTIQVHVPRNSQALENLSIDVPENVEFRISRIDITDGIRSIDTKISRQGQRLQIGFNRPISPDTQLQVDFNGVTRNMRVQLSVYYLYGKTVNGVNSFLGEAYFPQ